MSTPPDPVVVADGLLTASNEGVTPGPWNARHITYDEWDVVSGDSGYPGALLDGIRAKADAEFIALARTAAPLLAGAVLSLTDETKALREYAEEYGPHVKDEDGGCLPACPTCAALAPKGAEACAPGCRADAGAGVHKPECRT